MLFLIGGASRSGKSLLATRLMARVGVPWFSLDTLRMGLATGAPALDIDPDADDLQEAGRLWPIVRAMASQLIDDGRPYAIEGVCLDPHDVAAFAVDHRVAACFLGYPRLTPPEKAALTVEFRGGPNDWLADESEDEILAHLADGCRTSAALERSCAETRLPFFDTGQDFVTALAEAERHLLAALSGEA
ncbi:hypothetical protein [Sphingopyxis sp.]|uniref:hypothetical protein n=1 Tax=Sphingopyxis sp. TaxID=1908224 RepID=UPI003D6D0606